MQKRVDDEVRKHQAKGAGEPKNVQASSYPDLKTAEEVTKKVIEGNRAEIEECYYTPNTITD